jgi:hypothetical protein
MIRIRIQQLKLMRIHADPDPDPDRKPWTLKNRQVCSINQALCHFVVPGRTLNLLFTQSNCREKPGKVRNIDPILLSYCNLYH